MREIDQETLAAQNGQDGKPVYIAHNGKVYDVSASKMWKTGTHMKRHASGQDLSTDIQAAPHGPEVLERFPQIGILKTADAQPGHLPDWLESILERYPFFRRHPHPIAVHFPIVFLTSPVLFSLLSIITGTDSFETTGFHCLGVGTIMLIPAIFTGLLTWLINYQAKAMTAVRIKILLSILLGILSTSAFLWRLSNPAIMQTLDAQGLGYLLLIFSLMPVVSIIGFYGGALTFPHAPHPEK